jgi:hypothetical protein
VASEDDATEDNLDCKKGTEFSFAGTNNIKGSARRLNYVF